jgi:hypothetical protein
VTARPARRSLVLGAVAAGVCAAGALAVASRSPSNESGSWTFGTRLQADAAVVAAQAGELILRLRGQDGEALAGTGNSAYQPVAQTASGQALIAWTAPAADGGQELVGLARSDVARVSGVFADGSTVDLPLNELHGFAFSTAGNQLIELEGFDSAGANLASISVPRTALTCSQAICTVQAASRSPAAAAQPVYAVRGSGAAGTPVILARINPQTLGVLGRTLRFRQDFHATALSPDGTHLLGVNIRSQDLTIVDLTTMSLNRRLQLRLVAELGPDAVIRASAWPTANRVLALVQRYSKPYNRNVVSRTLVAIDPSSGGIVWRRKLTNKLALAGSRAAGDKLVLLLQPSSGRRPNVTVIVASATGRIDKSVIKVGRAGNGFNQARLITTSGAMSRAYVVTGGGTIYSIDLDNAHATAHHVAAPKGAPILPPAVSSLAAQPLGNKIVTEGVFTRPNGQPRAGIYLIDPTSWTARLVERQTLRFASNGDTLVTFGPLYEPGVARAQGGGGIAIYDANGVRRYHLYGTRKFAFVQLGPRYAFALSLSLPASRRPPILLPGTAGRRFAFDLATGKSLGSTLTPGWGSFRALIYPGSPALPD